MKKVFANIVGGVGSIIIALIIIAVLCGISWAIVSGFVWLICLCFSIEFNFLISTGVWLILFLLNLVFGKPSDSK